MMIIWKGCDVMSFTPSYTQIRNLLNENAVFIVPRYQRNYVWNEDEWKNLLEDLLLVVSKNEEDPEHLVKHFIGSFIFEKRSTNWDIVDGQQRLSTISILMACISKKLRILGDDNSSDAFSKYFFYTGDDNEKLTRIDNGSEFYKVFMAKYFNSGVETQNVSQLITGENIKIAKKDSNFRSCVTYFDEKLDIQICSMTHENKKNFLYHLRDAILNLDVIQIVANNKNDGYVIFQVLNSRGKPLETFELLKNYIFTYIKIVDGSDTASVIWDEILSYTEMDNVSNASIDKFMTNYITHRFGKTSKKLEFETIVSKVSKTEVKALLDDLKAKAKIYKNIVSGTGYSDLVNYVLSFLNTYKITQFRPVLLSIISALQPGDNKKLEKILLSIKNFLSIYIVICKEKTNRLEKHIYKYSKELNDNYSDDLCKTFLNDLFNELPSKEDFISKFEKLSYSKNKDWYPNVDVNFKKQITHVLMEYEIFTNSDDDPTPKKFTLEHVKNDSDGGQACSVGNIVPLSNKDNKACNGKTIGEKIEIYNRSSYSSPRLLVNDLQENFRQTNAYWSDHYIDGRVKKLANLFYNEIWKSKF